MGLANGPHVEASYGSRLIEPEESPSLCFMAAVFIKFILLFSGIIIV